MAIDTACRKEAHPNGEINNLHWVRNENNAADVMKKKKFGVEKKVFDALLDKHHLLNPRTWVKRERSPKNVEPTLLDSKRTFGLRLEIAEVYI